MADRALARTVHVVLPMTHRPLCGYEEEGPAPGPDTATVACPECSALLRSGMVRRSTAPRDGVDRRGPDRSPAREETPLP
jgi:hypothetical protein